MIRRFERTDKQFAAIEVRLAATLERVRLRGGKGRPHTRPKKLAGDKGYSYPTCGGAASCRSSSHARTSAPVVGIS